MNQAITVWDLVQTLYKGVGHADHPLFFRVINQGTDRLK